MRLALLALLLVGNIAYADCPQCQPTTEMKTVAIDSYSENKNDLTRASCWESLQECSKFGKCWQLIRVNSEVLEYNIDAHQWHYKASFLVGRTSWR